jgi:hypothetical protein
MISSSRLHAVAHQRKRSSPHHQSHWQCERVDWKVARSAEIGRAAFGWPRFNRCDAAAQARQGSQPNWKEQLRALVYQRDPLDAKLRVSRHTRAAPAANQRRWPVDLMSRGLDFEARSQGRAPQASTAESCPCLSTPLPVAWKHAEWRHEQSSASDLMPKTHRAGRSLSIAQLTLTVSCWTSACFDPHTAHGNCRQAVQARP